MNNETKNVYECRRNVALAVGIYDTILGLWPLISVDSFSAATGLNEGLGIVKVLGGAWAGLGLALLACHKSDKAIPILGVASTMAGGSLALLEIILICSKTIPLIFLAQVISECVIGMSWIKVLSKKPGLPKATEAKSPAHVR